VRIQTGESDSTAILLNEDRQIVIDISDFPRSNKDGKWVAKNSQKSQL